jgi:hypothetical protein
LIPPWVHDLIERSSCTVSCGIQIHCLFIQKYES